MTEINTATIKINPVIDIEGLDASIRAAVAQALRKMADEMDTPAATREPALWGYYIGDEVRYTEDGEGPVGALRTIGAVESGRLGLRLDSEDYEGAGYASDPSHITPA